MAIIVDRRHEVPDLARFLKPNIVVTNVEQPPIKPVTIKPNPREILRKLTDAPTLEQIGDFGPPKAAHVPDVNKDIPELGLLIAVFGRDSARMALLVLEQYPKLAGATLKFAAENLGVGFNKWSGEEPGRVFHEDRKADDPKAKELGRSSNWQFPFYGQVDANPLMATLMARYVKEGRYDFMHEQYLGRDRLVHTNDHAYRANLGWMSDRMSLNPERLIEYWMFHPGDIENQNWRDSGDSHSHKKGRLANVGRSPKRGVASLDVQVLGSEAFLDAEELYRDKLFLSTLPPSQRGKYRDLAEDYWHRGKHLQEAVMKHFLFKDERGLAFGLGRDRTKAGKSRLMEIRTSARGQVLDSRVLEGDDSGSVNLVEATIADLFSEDGLAASGVRTLDAGEVRFSPGAYHNGSVWRWDNGVIIRGLIRHGYFGMATFLKGLNDNVSDIYNIFPETCRGGFESYPVVTARVVETLDLRTGRMNRLEQPPQQNQGWNVCDKIGLDDMEFPTQAVDPNKRRFEEKLLSQPHVQRFGDYRRYVRAA